MAKSRTTRAALMTLCATSWFHSVTACDPSRDEPPPRKSAPAADAIPVRPGVAKGPPAGVVSDSWIADGKCNLEAVNGVLVGSEPAILRGSAQMVVSGWALDPTGKTPPDAVHVRFSSPIAGDYYGTASKRLIREDVNTTFGAQAGVRSGYEVEFDSEQLPEGVYALTTVMQFRGTTYICDNGRKVTRVRS
jgi:hypothetical protein